MTLEALRGGWGLLDCYALKMETARSYETSLIVYQSASNNNSGDVSNNVAKFSISVENCQ